MAVPKRKNSKQRGRKRRGGHMKYRAIKTVTCPKCSEVMIPHRVCPTCGYYKGRDIMHLEESE